MPKRSGEQSMRGEIRSRMVGLIVVTASSRVCPTLSTGIRNPSRSRPLIGSASEVTHSGEAGSFGSEAINTALRSGCSFDCTAVHSGQRSGKTRLSETELNTSHTGAYP